MGRTPKRVKKCSGCGEPLSCHKAGQYGKHCQGVDKDPPADKQPIELEDPNPKSAMDVLEQRKAELEKAIAEAELRNEVAALEKRLGALKSSGPTPPSGEAKQTGPKVSTSAEEAATLGAALHLGPGDLTLDHLRMNKELVTRAFHHAAINQALRDPTKWNNDWTELKDYYFDGDPDNLKGNNNNTGKPKTTVRTCYKYNKGECSSTSCRYAHYCSYCLDTTGQKYKHAESTCRRREFLNLTPAQQWNRLDNLHREKLETTRPSLPFFRATQLSAAAMDTRNANKRENTLYHLAKALGTAMGDDGPKFYCVNLGDNVCPF
uniref:C3H1-type domain-containing protein n=1 Tax=Branchiostoma floridae TaxID=7739 RepID=C3ZSG6_BRAFL|eukprot:XP_002588520.1 hypothetical protein BRAFLDRAFT_79474 [Branchiostoma floridae]